MIDNTLYDAFGQEQVSTMYTELNQYHVVMEVDPKFWQSPQGLNDIYLRSTNSGQVPLSAITRFEPTTAPITVSHQGQFPSVTVSFNLAPGVALSDAVRTIQADGTADWDAGPDSRELFRDFAGLPDVSGQRADSNHHGAAGGLYRPGHPLRKLHSSHYDFVHPPLSRGRAPFWRSCFFTPISA